MPGTKRKKKNKLLMVALILTGAAILLAGLAAVWLFLAPRQAASPAAETPSPGPTPPPSPAPTSTPVPAPVYRANYFPCQGGLFRPEAPLTFAVVAEALSNATGEEITYPGDGTRAVTQEALTGFLEERFDPERVAAAVSAIPRRGDETVTRAEAAVCLNLLLDIPAPAGESYLLPDVGPDYWAGEAVRAAAAAPEAITPEDGFFWEDGYLYCLDEDGYVLKNQYLGSLFFGPDGRYTSGSPELDDYVAAVIRENTDDAMDREARLKAVYEYCRDSFTYLRRNYYKIGDVGWQVEEALTMFSTGQGNCYSYASAFWAAARGLGYDAKIVSGAVNDGAPHGWVEMIRDGERRTFDVELEMVLKNIRKQKEYSLYDMTDAYRNKQVYIGQEASDNLAPRETNNGLMPR